MTDQKLTLRSTADEWIVDRHEARSQQADFGARYANAERFCNYSGLNFAIASTSHETVEMFPQF